MTHLLHIDSSARPDSYSRKLGAAFVDAWRTADPGGSYTYRDLATHPVPQITAEWTELCAYAQEHGITEPERLHETARTAGQRAAWAIVEPLLFELVAADVLLLGVPMYNFSIPAALKAWIDQVTFPRAKLELSVIVASSRGGSYAPGAPRAAVDHQERYLRDFFDGHFGVTDVTFVNAEFANADVDPLLADKLAAHQQSVADAFATAAELAAKLAGGCSR
ncbi:NAD(P)H-dependent oxidoreductase [Kribbella sp. NPDC003557]|uniref:FMN-dependent NADH-azoreductase n=1 Tax=Kribbella sp. NPDC003557 TaxID=3154449 RepID=UPI0033B22ADF